tara:strand:- start:198 stop:1004 length:807 start_codon:yes stop_codon:yes gene_type:complete
MNPKIGIGIVTCNRENFFRKCLESVVNSKADIIVAVNDGKPLDPNIKYLKKINCIQHETNKGVGISKNDAMKFLVNAGCEHIFIIEDDIIIKDSDIYNKYINVAKNSGIWHLMYAYHGPANKMPNKEPNPRKVITYEDGTSLSLNRHCVGAFCYYHKNILKHVGYMDETFVNAWEHVEHSYRCVKNGLLPGYWWWPDVGNSTELLDEQACSEDNSTIRPRDDWQKNIQEGAEYFASKHTYSPIAVPDLPGDKVVEVLEKINKHYSKDV